MWFNHESTHQNEINIINFTKVLFKYVVDKKTITIRISIFFLNQRFNALSCVMQVLRVTVDIKHHWINLEQLHLNDAHDSIMVSKRTYRFI